MTTSADTAVGVDDAWLELRPHFELAAGFWLAFVFTDRLGVAETLVRRAQAILASEGRSQRVHTPKSTDALQPLAHAVGRASPTHLGAEWVIAPTLPVASWEQLLLALNRRRDAIRRSLAGGLILVAPTA